MTRFWTTLAIFVFLFVSVVSAGTISGNLIPEAGVSGTAYVIAIAGELDVSSVSYASAVAPGSYSIDGTFDDADSMYVIAVIIEGMMPTSGSPAGQYPGNPFHTSGGNATGIDIPLADEGAFSGRIEYSGDFSNVYLAIYDAYAVVMGGEPSLEMTLPVAGPDYTAEHIPAGPKTVAAFVDVNGNSSWDDGEPMDWYTGAPTAPVGTDTLGVVFCGGGIEQDNVNFTITGIARTTKPLNFSIANHPNPFNTSTVFTYTVGAATDVGISVYNVAGELVSVPVNSYRNPGTYSFDFDASFLSSGLYFYRMETRYGSITKCFILLK